MKYLGKQPMRVYVRLFGWFSHQFDGYDSQKGITLDLPGNATVEDLIQALKMDASDSSVALSDGRVLRPWNRLQPGKTVSIFPVVYGG